MLIIKLGLGTGLQPNNFHDFRLTKTDNRRISTRFSTPCINEGWRVCQSEISIPSFYIYFVIFSVFCFPSTRLGQKSSLVRKLKHFLLVPREDNPGQSAHVTSCKTGLWFADEVRRPEAGLWLVEAGQDRSQAVWWSRGCRDSCQTPVLSPHPPDGEYWLSWAIIFICCLVLSVVMTSPAEMIGEERYLMLIVILITFKLLRTNTVTVTSNTINTNTSPSSSDLHSSLSLFFTSQP